MSRRKKNELSGDFYENIRGVLAQKKYQYILGDTGEFITLADWQKEYNYPPDKISENLKVSEIENHEGNFIISSLVIAAFEAIRLEKGKAININSGYRSPAEQKALRKKYDDMGLTGKNNPAAVVSAHNFGLALDLDGTDKNDTRKLYNAVDHIRKVMFPLLRVGYFKYKNSDPEITAVHIDVAAYYFGENKIFSDWDILPIEDETGESIKVPSAWRDTATW